MYAAAEWRKKLAAGNDFVSHVLSQPEVFIIGAEDDLRESRKARRRKDFVSMACTTASVSYREALSQEELVRALLTGKVPNNRHAHFHALLDEAPVELLKGLLEQVGRQATPEKVVKNFERIAHDLGASRNLRALLFNRPE